MNFIYLDNAATTKPNEIFFNESKEFAISNYFNPSALYRGGRAASDRINDAKETICKYFYGYKLIFTSCGTESDNTAIFGFFKRGNAVTTLGEHSAVFNSFETLRTKGAVVRYAKLNADGSVNVENLLSLVDKNTTFLSVVHVNNETGAINDINEIARRAKEISPRLIFHSDGVQAFGKLDTKLNSNFVDLYSASAHKIGGLKGVGALLYKNGLHIPPYLVGGGQQDGLRSGTENVLGIDDFAQCAKFAYDNISLNCEKIQQIRDRFIELLNSDLIKVISSENCSPYVVSISCNGLRGEVIQHMLEDEGVIVGTGSACSSKHPHSRVLKACGYSSSQLDGVLRISFIFDSNIKDAEYCAEKINACAEKMSKVINRR